MARYNYGYIDELRVKRRRRRRRLAFLIISSLVFLTAFTVFAFFFSGWFTLKEIRISGAGEVPEEEIKTLAGSHLNKGYFFNSIKPFSNVLFASSKTIEHSLAANFPAIDEVNVNKDFFKKFLTVEIKEREPAGIWCSDEGGGCFYFDEKGVMFKAAPRFSGQLFLVIEDGRGRDFNLTDSFDDRELFEKVKLAKNVMDEFKVVDYANFFLPEGSFEFWVKTKEGWYVYLDKESDITTQLVALKKFLDEKLTASRRRTLEYVDLKINSRIYYK